MALSAGTINFSDAEPATPQYDVTSKYRALPNPKILSGLAFPMPNGLGPTDLADFSFLGPIAKFSDLDLDPAPCYSGHASENISLEFPATKRLAFLPDDKEIKTPNLEYTSHWSLKGNIVSVHREMRASFDQTLCTGRVRQQTVSALTLIRNDYKINILLRPTH
jgi:hypothetical protein